MGYLPDALFLALFLLLAAKVKHWLDFCAKRARAEDQLHSFIHAWLEGEIPNNTEQFQETKRLLMLDWLDGHPRCTRIDFCRYFDQAIDGHCESFAIDAYFKRRELAHRDASNIASI